MTDRHPRAGGVAASSRPAGTHPRIVSLAGPTVPLNQTNAESRVGEGQAGDALAEARAMTDAELQSALDAAMWLLQTTGAGWDRLVMLKQVERERAQPQRGQSA